MNRKNYQSGAQWEGIVGYSRAVRKGRYIFVSGTTAVGATGEILGINDPRAQTRHALEIVERAVIFLGGNRSDIVRTRIFVTNIQDWQSVAASHREFFSDIQPATTMVEVRALILPEILVEIEADAICDDDLLQLG